MLLVCQQARAMCLGRHIFLHSCPSGQDILFTPEPGVPCNIKVKADHCMILCHHKDLPVLPLHIYIATHIDCLNESKSLTICCKANR